jgi:hypothetical protein
MTSSTTVRTTRLVAAAIALAVVIDVAWVRAPFLIILAVPFAVIAWRYRDRSVAGNVAVFAASVLYALLGITYIAANGLHAPAEPGRAAETIGVGDFVFAYIGTPLAIWLGARAGRALLGRRHAQPASAVVA